MATSRYGITGAAVAWSARCAADAALLYVAARRVLGMRLPLLRPLVLGAALPILVGVALAAAGLDGLTALGAAAVAGAGAVLFGWRVVLESSERRATLRLAFPHTTFGPP
jgi:hypothetical protein